LFLDEAAAIGSVCAVESRDVGIVRRTFLVPSAIDQDDDPFHAGVA
jgi:hypothetical protein